MRIRVAVLGAVVVAAVVLGACSSHSSHSSTPTIPESADFDAADVAFAQGMIPHHAQAIEMADMVPSRSTNPAVLALARRIAAAQDPEIATMTGWLRSWGRSVPMDMAHDGHDMTSMGSMSMDGMMTAAEMDRLSSSSGPTFDRLWLEMMIRHHEGALSMAQQELAEGEDPAAIALARSILDGQAAEIAEMRSLLAGLPA